MAHIEIRGAVRLCRRSQALTIEFGENDIIEKIDMRFRMVIEAIVWMPHGRDFQQA